MSGTTDFTFRIIFLVCFFRCHASSTKQISTSNKYLKIGALSWPPFLIIKKNERGEDTIGGVLGDYLEYIRESKNFTFTVVIPPDGLWGNCNGADNCTGVIGLVARNEVDFAINPFTVTPDRKAGVDFTRPVVTSFFAMVVPLKFKSKKWYFIDPFSYKVWLLYISLIPVYFLAMGVVEIFYYGHVNWDALAGFVLRYALMDNSYLHPNRTKASQQKLLIIICIWSYLVLVTSYSGNLTAMLAKPKLQSPITTLDELLGQYEVPWVIETDGLPGYFKSTAAPGSIMKRIFERATMMPKLSEPCYTAEVKKDGRYGAVCASESIRALISQDYSETGKCNYYIVEEVLSWTIVALAIQVRM